MIKVIGYSLLAFTGVYLNSIGYSAFTHEFWIISVSTIVGAHMTR